MQAQAHQGGAQPSGSIKFRSSPFFRVDKPVGLVTTLIRAGPGDRKVGNLSFVLTHEQRDQLQTARCVVRVPALPNES